VGKAARTLPQAVNHSEALWCAQGQGEKPRVAKARLDAAGAAIVLPLVGRYATSMEMAGVSFTLVRLDGELEGYLTAPFDCAFWNVR
jgi:hypothetical protein